MHVPCLTKRNKKQNARAVVLRVAFTQHSALITPQRRAAWQQHEQKGCGTMPCAGSPVSCSRAVVTAAAVQTACLPVASSAACNPTAAADIFIHPGPHQSRAKPGPASQTPATKQQRTPANTW